MMAQSRATRAVLAFVVLSIAPAGSNAKDPLAWPRISNSRHPDTFSYRIHDYDLAVFVSLAPDEHRRQGNPASREHVILQVIKGGKTKLSKGDRIMVPGDRPAEPGNLFLLVGHSHHKDANNRIVWRSIIQVSSPCFDYVVAAPSPWEHTAKRLAYFVKYLGSRDPQIVDDAFTEFANVGYETVLPFAGQLPTEPIRKRLADPRTPGNRLGLYGLMLGLCGQEEDAEVLQKIIAKPSKEYRLAIDGVISGYLLLTGEKGLDFLDQSRLKNRNLPFSERYAAMQAVRFMRMYVPGRIANERLNQSMRLLLDQPELTDLAISDLARWKDWSLHDRLMKMYGAGPYDTPAVKRSIVRYMFMSANDLTKSTAANTPKHVATGKANLAKLRKRDPKTVKQVEFLNRPYSPQKPANWWDALPTMGNLLSETARQVRTPFLLTVLRNGGHLAQRLQKED